MSSNVSPVRKGPIRLFWVFMIFFASFFSWAFFFELDKSVIIQGQIKPEGFPIIVQSRFEGKIKDVSTSEGATINKGDELISFEKEIDFSELREVEFKIVTSLLKIARLESQLIRERKFDVQSEKLYHYRTVGAETIRLLADEQLSVLKINLDLLDTELELLESKRQVKASELSVLKATISANRSDLVLAEKKLKLTESLFKKKFVGELDLLEAKSAKANVTKMLTEGITKLALNQNELAALKNELNAKLADHKKQTVSELVKIKSENANHVIQRDGTQARLKEFFILSPVSGVVSSLAAENPGQVISTGETVAEIIPKNTPLVFYGELPVQNIGNVFVGQKVFITPSNFDQRTDQVLNGFVVEIAEDAIVEENNDPYYQVVISFDENMEIKKDLKSGLTASASVLIGKTNVLGYYLEPLWRSLRFAMTEA